MKAIRIAAMSFLLLSAGAGWADEPAAAPAAAPAGTPKSVEDGVRERVAKKIPGKVNSVKKLPFGMFEVVIDSEIVYVDENADYLLTGHHFRSGAYQVGGPIGLVWYYATHQELRLGQPLTITKKNVDQYANKF